MNSKQKDYAWRTGEGYTVGANICEDSTYHGRASRRYDFLRYIRGPPLSNTPGRFGQQVDWWSPRIPACITVRVRPGKMGQEKETQKFPHGSQKEQCHEEPAKREQQTGQMPTGMVRYAATRQPHILTIFQQFYHWINTHRDQWSSCWHTATVMCSLNREHLRRSCQPN